MTTDYTYDETSFLNEAICLTYDQAEINRYRVGIWSQDQWEARFEPTGSEPRRFRRVHSASPANPPKMSRRVVPRFSGF